MTAAPMMDNDMTNHEDTPGDGKDGQETAQTVVDAPIRKRQGAVVRKTTRNRKYDWPAIEERYVEGVEQSDGTRTWPTIREVSDHFNVPMNRIGEHSSSGRWSDKRAVFQKRLTDQMQRERAKALGKEAVDLDSRALNTAKLGLQITMGRLAEIGKDMGEAAERRKQLEAMRQAGHAIDLKDLRSPVNYREMEALSKAAQTFHDMGRRALGEDVIKHEVTGADGGPIQSVIDVRAELQRDDPERLTRLIDAIVQAKLPLGDEDDYDDAEVVEDDDEQLAIEGTVEDDE